MVGRVISIDCNYTDKSLLTVKKIIAFPVPSLDVTYQTLSGREKLYNSLPGESLVSDNPAGDGKTANFFLQCIIRSFLSFPEINYLFSFLDPDVTDHRHRF